ncbi:MAG: phosphoglycerate kinase [Deltaproteobacteria bacterium]|nr:phosphoglycerate kinase [Deltaproteobacteria bacterium]
MNKLSIDDLKKVKGKRIFLRVDFNVPLDANQNITDNTRIKAALPTIRNLIKRGARLILVSHMGRPEGKRDESFSLKPVAEELERLLDQHVSFSPDVLGPIAQSAIDCLKDGDCLLMENIRFYPEESANDPQFAKEMASMVDLYVNDAFGAAHRAHASTVGVSKYFENAACGYLMKKELEFLSKLVGNPPRPFYSIIGGGKIKDKIKLVSRLIEISDKVIVGGGMAYTFLKVKGFSIGKSVFDNDSLKIVQDTIELADKLKKELLLPIDHVVAKEFNDECTFMAVERNIPDDYIGLDIGPKTIEMYKNALKGAQTIFWNGPMGVFELKNFQRGTFEVASEVSKSDGITVVGGGDSVEAINRIGMAGAMSHISTGGGASLEFLEGHKLPGIEALADQ